MEKTNIEYVLPEEIEKRSFAIIAEELAERGIVLPAEQAEQYLQDTVEYVKTERAYLREGLEARGIRVVSGEADFLLLYTTQPIYDRLLAKGILIRNCENFRGLGEGYYRIAVKKHEENEVLLRELAMGD